MRGSTAIEDVEEMLGVHFGDSVMKRSRQLAGLLSHVSGKVQRPREIRLEGFRFEVLEPTSGKCCARENTETVRSRVHATSTHPA